MAPVQRLALAGVGVLALALTPLASVGADSVRRGSEMTPPLPAVAALAAQRGLPLSGVDPLAEAAELRTGDVATVLFTLTQRGERRQWLAEFRAIELTPEEQAKPTGAVAQIHTSTGRMFEFTSRSAALSLTMLGPCRPGESAAAKIGERQARILVQTDFLRAGFDRECEISLRMVEQKSGFPYHLSSRPFPAERVAKDRALALASGLREEDERTIASVGPALDEFFRIADHTPGLKELVATIADFPPLWSWITGGGTGFFLDPANAVRLEGEGWGLPGAVIYRSPFQYVLKGATVMKGTLYFAPARPPLLTCAGIVALIVQSPKNPDRQLELRVLAARRATAPRS